MIRRKKDGDKEEKVRRQGNKTVQMKKYAAAVSTKPLSMKPKM